MSMCPNHLLSSRWAAVPTRHSLTRTRIFKVDGRVPRTLREYQPVTHLENQAGRLPIRIRSLRIYNSRRREHQLNVITEYTQVDQSLVDLKLVRLEHGDKKSSWRDGGKIEASRPINGVPLTT